MPLSGQTRYQGNGGDIDIYAFGTDAAPLVGEVKARGNGEGFAMLDRRLGDNDVLFLRHDRSELLIVLPLAAVAAVTGRLADFLPDSTARMLHIGVAGAAPDRSIALLLDGPTRPRYPRRKSGKADGCAAQAIDW